MAINLETINALQSYVRPGTSQDDRTFTIYNPETGSYEPAYVAFQQYTPQELAAQQSQLEAAFGPGVMNPDTGQIQYGNPDIGYFTVQTQKQLFIPQSIAQQLGNEARSGLSTSAILPGISISKDIDAHPVEAPPPESLFSGGIAGAVERLAPSFAAGAILGPVAGDLSKALGISGPIGTGAVQGGLTTAFQGGSPSDIAKGAITGAAGSGAGAAAGTLLPEGTPPIVGSAIKGAVSGAASALIGGRDAGAAALTGGLSSGASKGISELTSGASYQPSDVPEYVTPPADGGIWDDQFQGMTPEQVAAAYPELYPGGRLPAPGETTRFSTGTNISPSLISQALRLLGTPLTSRSGTTYLARSAPTGFAVSPESALGYTPAGDTEPTQTGGKRRKVWNISSLRTGALGEGLEV